MKKIKFMLATGFYSGLFPKAPGTAGSIACLLPFIFFSSLLIPEYLIPAILIAFLLGLWSITDTEKILGERKYYRGKKTRTRDQQQIVIDEFVGQWIAIIPILFWPDKYPLLLIIIGLILFRIFDIGKQPWPILYLDEHPKLKNPFGVMLDDIVAGIYAAISLIIVILIFL